ncbi:hypothetical protein ACLBKU_11940 [Erythrobacter sp. NE805]|uniref:hypothetical protein n=1 Tax=Erythrobacter sp. NE805 TaxID=3389875 RepID=UPI00396B4375
MSAGVQDFIAAMTAAGVVPVEPIAGKLVGGKIVRFRCQGDGRKRNGWAIFFDGERPGGAYGNHKQNTGTITWSAKREGPPLSPEERARLREQIAAEEARRAREQASTQEYVAREARATWAASSAADPAHPYAATKRMKVAGLRQSGEALLVPMRDIEGVLWNLQRIYPDGTKRFVKGGRILGLMTVIEPRLGFARGVVCEGYATGDAIAQALGAGPVVVAFNTANLGEVVAACVDRHPRADWVIAADDDHLTGTRMEERGQPYQNPGVDKAREVAVLHGCRVAYPLSVVERWVDGVVAEPANVDFSDLLLAGGAVDIRAAFDGARRPAGSAQPSLAERIGRAA